MAASDVDCDPDKQADPIPDSLADLPPSAKLCYRVLSDYGAMTQHGLTSTTGLCDRTIRFALNRLQDHGAVDKWQALDDPRLTVYDLENREKGPGKPYNSIDTNV